MFKLSRPTKAQVVKAVEFAAVTFVTAAVAAWLRSANPFSRDALVAAVAAGGAALYGIVKAFVTVGA